MSDPLAQQLFRRSGTALIISVLAGLVAFVWPDITALSLALVIGLWAVMLGVSQIALAFDVKRNVGSWWLWLITGVVTTLFGLFLVILPGPGILSLLGLLASFAILIGILLIPPVLGCAGWAKALAQGSRWAERLPMGRGLLRILDRWPHLPARRGSSVRRLTGP